MAAKKKETPNVVQLVTELAEPITAQHGLELVDVEYVKEGGQWYLRLYIDRAEAPIDHQCCQLISDALSEILDVNDPIPQSYYLEVSSPGLERPLKKASDFTRFAGQEVLVTLYEPLDGQKSMQGLLQGLADDCVVVQPEKGPTVAIPRAKIAKVRLVAQF